jgi:hypothetical protein
MLLTLEANNDCTFENLLSDNSITCTITEMADFDIGILSLIDEYVRTRASSRFD